MQSLIRDFEKYDALGLAELVRRKEVKPIEIVDTVIERIERLNPTLNFIAHKTHTLARKLAVSTLPDGPFRGVPFMLKDLVLMYAGVPTTNGCNFYKDYVPQEDSFVVQLIKKAGMILVGKTTTPELGRSLSTESRLFGATRNPWNLEYAAGGSSGGSAAAVAARVLPLADGSDGSGSIRMPASNCGLVGLKPSRGRVSLAPHYGDFLYGMLCLNCVSLTVRDTAAYLDVISQPVPGDPYQLVKPDRSFLENVTIAPGKLKIGFTAKNPMGGAVHPSCIQAVEETAKLCSELGHEVIEMKFTFDQNQIGFANRRIYAVLAAKDLQEGEALVGRPAKEADFELYNWEAAQHGKPISGIQHAIDLEERRKFGRRIAGDCQPFDIVLTPTMPVPPYKLGIMDMNLGTEKFVALFGTSLGFVQPFNMSGQPAMSLPLHWTDDGLPIGVQLVGHFAEEATIFRLAGQIEKARPWIHRKPPICA